MNTKALYNLTYGVYLLSARDGEKDNACIINTAVQVANNPTRISVAVIKANLTNEIIAKTGRFNLSAITTEAEFSLFQLFGMKSGRDGDKFQSFTDVARSENGLYYMTKWANAFFSLKVVESQDLATPCTSPSWRTLRCSLPPPPAPMAIISPPSRSLLPSPL